MSDKRGGGSITIFSDPIIRANDEKSDTMMLVDTKVWWVMFFLMPQFLSAQIDFGGGEANHFSLNEIGNQPSIVSSGFNLSLDYPLAGESDDYLVGMYVDLNKGSEVQDYSCGEISYQGHKGTDFMLFSFYRMDEGVPILAAAGGRVKRTNDGEFDRNTSFNSEAFGNHVVVKQTDGSEIIYAHMRKNSVRVSPNQYVSAGDTLGLVGSSGNSAGPHLHFEIDDHGNTVDPYAGECDSGVSSWNNQPHYVGDLDFDLILHGTTAYGAAYEDLLEEPPTKTHYQEGKTVYGWIVIAGLTSDDHIKANLNFEGQFYAEADYILDGNDGLKWGYVAFDLPTGSQWYGDWEIEVVKNAQSLDADGFRVDGLSNQAPNVIAAAHQVGMNGKLEAEFVAEDADGAEVSWFTVVDQPNDGTIKIDGGRRRKFIYTPDQNYHGIDEIQVFATDDEGLEGGIVTITFEVTDDPLSVSNDTAQIADFPSESEIQVYPNPFVDKLNISFYQYRSENVKVVIYNLLGQQIAVLHDGFLIEGDFSATWRPVNLPAAVYFCQISAGGRSQVVKVVYSN